MKKQGKDYSSYSISIRRNNRKKENERLMNSIRFASEFQACMGDEDDQQPVPELTPEYLEELLRQNNIEFLFHMIVMGGEDTIKTAQNALECISAHLFQRLGTPKGALVLNKFCKYSELFITYLYYSQRIKDVIAQLKKMPIGSKQHNIYLSCVCYILENKDLIQVEQLQQLYPYVQDIFYHEAASGFQSSLVTRMVSCLIDCSSSEIHFPVELILDYFESLWKTDNVMNHLNIYLSAIAVVKRKIYKKSLSILINAARVVLRGRGTLHTAMETDIPSKISILLSIFRFYNDYVEYMDTCGEIYSQKFKIYVTLHQFLLEYECDIFSDFQRSEVYLSFLQEFCKNGPSEQIAKKWYELGLISYLQSELTESRDVCYCILKIYLTLLSRDINSTETGKILNGYDLKSTLVKVMKMFNEDKIVDTCAAVFEYLELL